MNSVYLDFVTKSFLQKFAYRTNSYISIVSAIFKLSVLISVWSALFKDNPSVNGITFSDMINFVVINLIVSSLIGSQIGNKLAKKVEDGSIALDFIRPVNLKWYMIADQLGENLFRTLFNTLPVTIIAVIFLGFRLPDEVWRIPVFMLSIVLGITLIYIINYVLGLLAFWLKTSFYTNWFLGAFMELFAGTFVPLWFYPEPLYTIAHFLPFYLISFEPISIFLGKSSVAESIQIIVMQLVWISAFLVLEAWMWKKIQTKVIVQGG